MKYEVRVQVFARLSPVRVKNYREVLDTEDDAKAAVISYVLNYPDRRIQWSIRKLKV